MTDEGTQSQPFAQLGVAATAAAAVGMVLGSVAGAALRRPGFSFQGRTVVITGGSRGLGYVLARELSQEGARVAILARDFHELAAARDHISRSGGEVYAVPCNVTDRGDVENAMHNVVQRFGSIDVLVNNAGMIQVGPLENMTIGDYEDAMAVHFWGPLYSMTAALPWLAASGQGRIVNISSFAGLFPVPHLAPYTASKFALVGLSEAWGAELQAQGICVTTVAPGPMRTGSHVNAYFKGQPEKEFAWFADSMGIPGISTSAKRAARKIMDGCRKGVPYVVIGASAKAMVMLHSVAPSLTQRAVRAAARMMPGTGSNVRRTGWESRSPLAPRAMTWPADRNIRRNFQHIAPQAPGQ